MYSLLKIFQLFYMSRVGKRKIKIPAGVTVEIINGVVKVKGSKGELKRILHPAVIMEVKDGEVITNVNHPEDKKERSLWGAFSAHVANMVKGVTDGFKKELEINGVGYKVAMQGTDLKLDVGFSHPIIFKIPEGVAAAVEKNVIKLTGADIELVGQVAAEVRNVKKPEPYKGKGIKYIDETLRHKAGKTATKAAA